MLFFTWLISFARWSSSWPPPRLLVPAYPLPAEAIGIGTRAPVVGIGNPSLCRGPTRGFSIAGVAAPFAHDQSLEQVALGFRAGTPSLSIFLELSLYGREEIFAHQRGNIEQNLVISGCINSRHWTSWTLGTTALGTEPLRLVRSGTSLAESGRTLVRRILEHQPDRRTVPSCLALACGNAVAQHAALDFANRAPLLANPLEDQSDDTGLFGQDLIACLTIAVVLAYVSLAVGCTAQYVDRPPAGGVLLAASAAFHDLGTLILCDHTLDLK